jgi:hypothetical protein
MFPAAWWEMLERNESWELKFPNVLGNGSIHPLAKEKHSRTERNQCQYSSTHITDCFVRQKY